MRLQTVMLLLLVSRHAELVCVRSIRLLLPPSAVYIVTVLGLVHANTVRNHLRLRVRPMDIST
jgi:hypothetical protein